MIVVENTSLDGLQNIHHELTNSNTSQENGITEHTNHIFISTTYIMLSESNLSKNF